MKENKSTLVLLWVSFIISILLYTFFVKFTKGFPLEFQEYIKLIQNIFNVKPKIITVLYLVGFGEFVILIGGKNLINTVFEKFQKQQKLTIIWGISEVMAILGLLCSFLGNSGIFYLPMGLLSLIAILYWHPLDNEETKKENLPYTVE